MRPKTNELLIQFESLNWFHAVGKPVAGNVKCGSLWLDALRHLDDDYFEMMSYLRGNELEKRVASDENGGEAWQRAVEELRPYARRIVTEKVRSIRENKRWSTRVDMVVDYDLSHIFLEKEFESPDQHFFTDKAHWYLLGHFPCGLTRRGKLIVY